MKKILGLILCIALLPQLASAQLKIAALDNIRSLDGSLGGARPASAYSGGFVPAKFKTVPNEDYVDPDRLPPPNIKQEHIQGLIGAMILIEKNNRGLADDAKPQEYQLSQEDVQRLVGRVVQIDRHFVDPVSSDRWEEIVIKMIENGSENYDPADGGNWDKVVDGMLKTGVKELKDPHTVYFDPEELKKFAEGMAGQFAGIGVTMKQVDKGVEVDIVFPEAPAQKAGLQEKDVITAVDGVDIAGKEFTEISKRIKGKPGTDVMLSIERNGQPLAKPVAVTRDQVKVPHMFSKMVSEDIGYIFFSQFQGDTDEMFKDQVSALKTQGAAKLIIDVRGNPGGQLDTVSEIASEFLLDGQPILLMKKQGKEIYRNVTDGDGMFSDMPVVILVNGGSASASEILAGAMQDHVLRPVVIGTRSYGKGTAQSVTPGRSGRALKLTGHRWYTPDDRSIDADRDPETGEKIEGTGGVEPDTEVEVTDEQAAKIFRERFRECMKASLPATREPDPALEKGIEILSGLSSKKIAMLLRNAGR